MAIANYISSGSLVDYTPSSDTAAGSVVVHGTRVGVTKVAISANVQGVLHVEGVFEIDCASGTTFSAGALLYWSASTSKITTTNTDTFAGRAAVAKTSGQLKAVVRLTDA